ncbi:MAG: PEP-CTERM sorting domain-containing protein [Pirellulales bacterium]|nr:PEP-CTERM sorting domain-containing protein [Pirellulales bacterium]
MMNGKNWALVLAVCALLACAGNVQASVLAHWTFEENGGTTVNDVTGNGYNGTLVNFADTSANAGQYEGGEGWTDGALNFAGYSLANVAGGAGVVKTTLPISAMKNRSFTLEAVLSQNAPKMQQYSPFFNTDKNCCWFFGKSWGEQDLHFSFDGLAYGFSAPVPDMFDGNPHHIAMVFDDVRNTLATYVDYQLVSLVGHQTGVFDSKFDTNVLVLGGTAWNSNERWDGYAYEARITVDQVLGPADFLAVPAPTVAPPTPLGSQFAFADFSDPTGLRARGSAGPYNNRLRLTSSTVGSQAGAYWLNGTVQFVSDLSFNTKFAFEISEDAGTGGADGMAFVIQNAGVEATGWAGGDMGLNGLGGAYLAVELDTWDGGLHDQTAGNWNHIAVDLSGVQYSIAETGVGVIPEFLGAGVLNVWVDYNGATDEMKVYFSNTDVKPDTPVITTMVDLAAHFGGETDLYVGFVGAIGGAVENHDIVSWNFQSIPEPSTWVLLATALVGLVGYIRRRK